jgi:predicted secreted Zn-dependent protease
MSSGGMAGTNAGMAGTNAGMAGTNGGAGGRNGGAGGMAGGGMTGCEDPFVSEDTSRLAATDEVETYEVVGHSARDIRTSINQRRDGDYDARTDWNIRWRPDDCASSRWTISLDVLYVLPEWNASEEDDVALIDAWTTYMDALYCHEYGHGRLAVQCANEVYDAVSALPGGDCTTLQSRAETVAQNVLDTCRERDIDYDDVTNHGATMGAVFPP